MLSLVLELSFELGLELALNAVVCACSKPHDEPHRVRASTPSLVRKHQVRVVREVCVNSKILLVLVVHRINRRRIKPGFIRHHVQNMTRKARMPQLPIQRLDGHASSIISIHGRREPGVLRRSSAVGARPRARNHFRLHFQLHCLTPSLTVAVNLNPPQTAAPTCLASGYHPAPFHYRYHKHAFASSGASSQYGLQQASAFPASCRSCTPALQARSMWLGTYRTERPCPKPKPKASAFPFAFDFESYVACACAYPYAYACVACAPADAPPRKPSTHEMKITHFTFQITAMQNAVRNEHFAEAEPRVTCQTSLLLRMTV